MIDLDRGVGFQWDIGNSRKSTDGHGISQAEAEQVFANGPLLLVEDVAHSQLEPRFHALGATQVGRRLHVTFALREANTLIRVISALAMSRKEMSKKRKSIPVFKSEAEERTFGRVTI